MKELKHSSPSINIIHSHTITKEPGEKIDVTFQNASTNIKRPLEASVTFFET